jgi:hypothetical protein
VMSTEAHLPVRETTCSGSYCVVALSNFFWEKEQEQGQEQGCTHQQVRRDWMNDGPCMASGVIEIQIHIYGYICMGQRSPGPDRQARKRGDR